MIPLRRRLTFWYALILTFGLGLFAVSLWLTARWRLEDSVDSHLLVQAQDLQHYLEHETHSNASDELREELREFAGALPDGRWLEVRDESGQVLVASDMPVPAVVPRRTPEFQRVDYREQPYRTIQTVIFVRNKDIPCSPPLRWRWWS